MRGVERREGEVTREEEPSRVGSHSHVRNPEKYPDCRTDLIGGAATQTFDPGGKHPRAATVHDYIIVVIFSLNDTLVINLLKIYLLALV